MSNVLDAAGRNPDLAKFSLALERDLYPQLAKQNAEAVQGLNPKINVWNTGGGGGDGAVAVSVVRSHNGF